MIKVLNITKSQKITSKKIGSLVDFVPTHTVFYDLTNRESNKITYQKTHNRVIVLLRCAFLCLSKADIPTDNRLLPASRL